MARASGRLSPGVPALTVVIPVWGAHYTATLPRAVASVRAEDPDAPIVVVDNASEAALPAMDGVLVIRSNRRMSAGAVRNLGLERVETEGVVFLDADDELAPDALAAMRAGLAADPAVAVHSMALIEADTGRRHRSPRRFVVIAARARRAFAFATALWSLYPIQGAAAMRTKWVREAGGYADCSGGEDWVLAVSQAFRGRIAIDPRPGLVYHAAPDSLWRQSRGTADLLAAARQVRRRLEADPAVAHWVTVAMPVIAVFQWLLVTGVRPPYRAARSGLAAIRRA